MKILFGILVIAIASINLSAQEEGLVNDPDAEILLQEVSAKFNSFPNVKASFGLAIKEPGGDWMEESSGTIFLKEEKFKIQMEEYEITCDGKTSWMFSPSSNEVQISYFEVEEDMFTPSQLFNMYSDKYIYRIKNTSGNITTVELTPLDKDQSYFKIDLDVNSIDKTISKCMIYEKSGIRFIYTISNIDMTMEISESYFTFDPSKHPEIEVIDLR